MVQLKTECVWVGLVLNVQDLRALSKATEKVKLSEPIPLSLKSRSRHILSLLPLGFKNEEKKSTVLRDDAPGCGEPENFKAKQ